MTNKNNIKTEWDLSLFFKSDKEAIKNRQEAEKTAKKFADKWEKRKDYLSQEKALFEAISEYEKLNRFYGANFGEYAYWELKQALNQNDSKIKAAVNIAAEISQRISNQLLFFENRLAKISKQQQNKFLKSKKLLPYRYFLKRNFQIANYLLSESEEKILTLKHSVAMENWVKMTEGFLVKETAEIISEKGKKEKCPFSKLIKVMESENKKTRDSAGKEMNRILSKWVEVAEAELNSILADKKINDELRKMDRPDLSRYISDGVEPEIADALTNVVIDNFHLAKRFYKLLAKLKGVKQLEYWERNLGYGKNKKKYSYSSAIQLIRKVFSNLDKEFLAIFDSFLKNGQIDAYSKKGKTNGAFCAHARIIDPIYVLLNHDGSIHDVLTIAHEMGHAINDELMRKQNSLNFGTALFTAETASTFMEDFIFNELLKEVSDEEKLSLIIEKLKAEIATIYRQIACANFERELHKLFRLKGYLSKEEIGAIFQKHMVAYMGSAVKQSVGAENWWVYWSHIRRFFYTYSYAGGFLISKKLQANVRKNPEYIKEVKKFLSAGLSDSPKNIFKSIGLDITKLNFWKEGVKETEALLQEAEKLARKLKKI